MTIKHLLTGLTLVVALATVGDALARRPGNVRFVADRGYTGPRRVRMNASPHRAPRGYVPRGRVRHSGQTFRNYLTAKSRGIYDPGYRHWLNGNGVVRRR